MLNLSKRAAEETENNRVFDLFENVDKNKTETTNRTDTSKTENITIVTEKNENENKVDNTPKPQNPKSSFLIEMK